MSTAPDTYPDALYCELCGEPATGIADHGFASCEDHHYIPVDISMVTYSLFTGKPLPLRAVS